ncbi:MAG TPA: ATP-binding protein [Candidatus Dormibacteraeota bacterium]|nr:ATP-binding protein [Candidatus Dormibacteraeota bacterium]
MIRALGIRPSARLRLTATFAVLFLLAGALLLGLTYFLVQQTLPSPASGAFLTQLPDGTGIYPQPTPGADPGNGQTIIRVANQVQQQILFNLLIESGVALALMAVISSLLGWIMAGRVLSPVHQITATARRLSQETLHERIGLTGPDDEMKELADTFDAMLARLDAAFESQQRFVGNASHELRTPLATQRALVDVNLADPNASPAQLRATLEKIRAVTDESEHLVMSLLALAKSERGLEHRTPVDLAAIAQEFNGGDGLRIEESLDSAVVPGDRALLRRMIGNLVDNATRYNIRDGWIKVATGLDDGQAFVRVSNSGRIIPDHAVETLFQPFRRLDGDRLSNGSGAGLGLSIVRAIATAHGGTAEAKPLEEGGLEVSIILPTTRR